MVDVLGLYAPGTTPRRNRVPCPIHGGTGYNFSYTDTVYHCFKCGAGGDVIGFVMELFQIPFRAALDKINTDFGIYAPTRRKPTLREQRDSQAAMRRRKQQQHDKAISRKIKQVEFDLYVTLQYAWVRYNNIKKRYRPKRTDTEWHPLFVEAIYAMEVLEWAMDDLR